MGTLRAKVRYHCTYDVDIEVEADTEEDALRAFAFSLTDDLTSDQKYRVLYESGAVYVTVTPSLADSDVDDDDDPEWEGDE